MEFLPKALGTRPRLACELRAEGIVAARAEDASALLSAVSRVPLAEGVMMPQLRAGAAPAHTPATQTASPSLASTPSDHAAVVAAVRKALEAVVLRSREVTLIVPDAAARVLLLDFDTLPGKLAEALPVVRFRLKKLLPFDSDDAAVSYQIMASSKGIVRVVAVAMPRELLAEYEAIVRDAGFEPGAVLPSTLAALASLPESEPPSLIVNADAHALTTAIVKAGVLLLHRTMDLRTTLQPDQVALDAQRSAVEALLPLVNRDTSAQEWAMQEPVGFSGPNDTATIQTAVLEKEIAREIAQEIAEDIEAERSIAMTSSEIAQAISVAAAYFEDTLETAPRAILTTGTIGAQALAEVLDFAGVGPLPVEDITSPGMLGPGATTASNRVPMGWLAGVRGALAN
jgi:type IV pilus assembly protein PilM